MASPKVVRWGIIATGGIARTFTKDILIHPSIRNVNDILHVVTAVASSSSINSAAKFITEVVAPNQSRIIPVPYGSYEELVQDATVDIVYIATPHSHHYQNAMLCLQNGKSVLCEKVFTVNAAQAKALFVMAKEKKLFLMEAVWTRFLPISIEVKNLIRDNAIGEVLRVISDLSLGVISEEAFDVDHRMVNTKLAGGALLDLGEYDFPSATGEYDRTRFFRN